VLQREGRTWSHIASKPASPIRSCSAPKAAQSALIAAVTLGRVRSCSSGVTLLASLIFRPGRSSSLHLSHPAAACSWPQGLPELAWLISYGK
jgi:hypothetical protein